jgi:hypothetical protein
MFSAAYFSPLALLLEELVNFIRESEKPVRFEIDCSFIVLSCLFS